MKKILLTTAAIVAVSSSALGANMTNEGGLWYVKAHAGVTKFQKNSGYKSKTDAIAAIGVGYNIMDNLRADVTLDHAFDPKMTSEDANNRTELKLDANTVLLNIYTDVLDTSMAKVFVGAGAGVARVKAKANQTAKATNTKTNLGQSKSNSEFAYALYAGVSSEIDAGMYAELMYSFKDYGKVKGVTNAATPPVQTNLLNKRLMSHNVTIGMRFDI